MRIEGKFFKNKQTGGFWAIEIPALGIHTQAKNLKEVLEMAIDAVETVVDKEGFEAQAIFSKQENGTFFVFGNSAKLLIAAILRTKRLERGLTARDIVKAMGERSETGYLRYERGENTPSLEKLDEILTAMDPNFEPIFKFG